MDRRGKPKKTIAQVRQENKEKAEAEERKKQKARDKKKRQKAKKDNDMVERVNQAERNAEAKEKKDKKILEIRDLIQEFNNNIGIAFQDPPEKYFELRDQMLTEFGSKLITDLSVEDLFVNKQGVERRKGGKSLKSIAYNEIIKRAQEFPQTLFDRIDGIERQISTNKAFDEYMIPREQKKRQQEINRKSSIEARQPLIEARDRRELKERRKYEEPIRKEYVRRNQITTRNFTRRLL